MPGRADLATTRADPRARTASETVAEQIRARIATGALTPGDMLPSETSLLDEFGVARPTMREALRILESDGLVTILRGAHGGARVNEPDIATLARRAGLHLQVQRVRMGDLMAALRIIQPGGVALAAYAATPAQVADLRTQIERVSAAGGVEAFTSAATEFLNGLMRASGNQALTLVSTLLDQLVRAETLAYIDEHATDRDEHVDLEFRAWCVDQYSQLIDLIEAGQSEQAETFWRRHLDVIPPPVDDASALTVYQPRRARRGSP